jgi:hypothetical protein
MNDRAETPSVRPRPPVSARLFRYLLDLEVEKALRLRYRVSLLCVTPDVAAGPGAGALVRHIARVAAEHLRRTDVAAVLSPGAAGLLLLDAGPRTLAAILDRIGDAGEAGRPRFAHGGQVATVSGGGGSYPDTAPSGAALLDQTIGLMRRARREGGDRLLLPPALAAAPVGP